VLISQLAVGTPLRVDGSPEVVVAVEHLDGGGAALILDGRMRWSTLAIGYPDGTAELYEIADPATLVASEHAAARARIADEDAFWAQQGDPDAVIGELAPADSPPTRLSALVHDDFLACDEHIAGVLYDVAERRVYWVVRGVETVALDRLGLEVS
jgi:hypothetical protein